MTTWKGIPQVRKITENCKPGWYIGFFESEEQCAALSGPFATMGAAIANIDRYCAENGIDNRVRNDAIERATPECPKCGNLYDHRYPCVS